LAIATAGLVVAAGKKPQAMGIDSVKTAPPVIVATEPRDGADDVDPALTEIKITFSKEMQDGNWAFAQVSKEMFPQTTGKPHYLEDHRTCVLPVKLEPGKTYILALNKPPFDSFMDTEKRKALEYMLVFETRK
jgi:RNA polymerase sigma-70 factor (ECF subfamily)